MNNFGDLLRWGLLSVLIFQVLVIAFQIFINKRKEAFYYLLYIVFVFLYNFRFVLLDLPVGWGSDLIPYLDRPMVALVFWSYFKFARHFLEIPSLDSSFNKIGKTFELTMIAGALSLAGLIHFIGSSKFFDRYFNVFSLYAAISSAIQLFYFVKIRKTTLNSFVVTGAILILMGSTTTFLLYEWQKINAIFNPDNLTIPHLVATFLELVVFNTGISLKSYIVENEKRKVDQVLLAQMREKEIISKELYNVKSSISADLHDDIGATFNSIDIYATVADKAIYSDDVPMALEYLKKIRSLTAESISDMRDTIWMLRQNERIGLDVLVQRWMDRAKPLLDAKGIQIRFDGVDATERFIPLNVKRHLYFCLKEVLNNILKHSGTDTMEVRCFQQDGKNFISIRDFGTGFETSDSMNGEGLNNIGMRMKQLDGTMEITTSPGKGTTITLGI